MDGELVVVGSSGELALRHLVTTRLVDALWMVS
jgi:hypothetical protein